MTVMLHHLIKHKFIFEHVHYCTKQILLTIFDHNCPLTKSKYNLHT
jgi:hypothetical protein